MAEDDLVSSVELLCPLQWYLRWDVFPFLVLYTLLFGVLSTQEGPLSFFAFVAIPCLLGLQIFFFLLSQWSVTLRCRLGHYSVTRVAKAQRVLVKAAKNAGKDRIVDLLRHEKSGEVKIADKLFLLKGEYFEFQKVIYSYDAENNTFAKIDYPCTAPIKTFLESQGHETQESVEICETKWGSNEFDIPIPLFLDLYLEHLTAPFFVFQVLCLFLWSLDDYWYYSAFTLIMLMFFEGMMCRQRQGGLQMLRNMRRPPIRLYVLRGSEWVQKTSDEIVPGDIISLTSEQHTRGGRGGGGGQDRSSEDASRLIPCDAIIIRGSCVVNEAMLTGESVPQIKETIRNADDRENGIVDLGDGRASDATWRRHLVFGGTTILQHTEAVDGETLIDGNNQNYEAPPDWGCTAVVVRTGFGTTQGGLMRKILFATERVNATSAETVYFIGVLVVFAMVASAAVLYGGLRDESRNRFKLALHCIMIITSVVPPELPMELSLAVTNSLAALNRGLVFCTEPFRIPFAGKLTVLCFDKTGTLTKDKMILRGIVGAQEILLDPLAPHRASDLASSSDDAATPTPIINNALALKSVQESSSADCPDCVLCTMAACNSLFQNKGVVQGDPLEVATMMASGFDADVAVFASSSGKGSVGLGSIIHAKRGIRVLLRHRYPFSSALKRMSVVVSVEYLRDAAYTAASSSLLWVFTKGAPEVLEDKLVSVPAFYNKTYQHHMSQGKRVLALACKQIDMRQFANSKGRNGSNSSSSSGAGGGHDGEIRDLPRGSAESGLTFIGFLVFDCDLKADSKSVIRDLRTSKHQVMIITGDSSYTAADVGRRLGLLKSDKALLMLQKVTKGNSINAERLVWRNCSSEIGMSEAATCEGDVDFQVSDVRRLSSTNNLCVTGPALQSLGESVGEAIDRAHLFSQLCPYVVLFARVSPAQKEEIVLALNDAGMFTLMCGDGTNDVGALKAAHVGVSIVNDPEFESLIEVARDPSSGSAALGKGEKKAKGTSSRDRMARAIAELQQQELDPTIVKLGDASIASPFTARRTSIDSVLTVLRQGRCTLVTTIQVFKILALNCLVSAYMMSALYLRGFKQGDMQMTANGIVTAGLFFLLSQAKPLVTLSPQKPPSSVFAASVALSVLGQFISHLGCLLATLYLCEKHIVSDDSTLSADGKFQPNVVNSAVFLLSAVMQVNNFVINYRGHPFTQSIQDNTPLWRSVVAIYIVLVIVAGGQLEPLNDFLQMAPFPSAEFQTTLVLILLVNFALGFGADRLARNLE